MSCFPSNGLSEVVLLQGAGSCPTHSTAYQAHIQLSMKEGWKDRGIIGRRGRDRTKDGWIWYREEKGMGSSWKGPADSRTGAMMDDALSESDNIFSQSPKQDRAASEVVTPLMTPISAALGLCKLELTTPPCLLKICTPAMPR
ncbi:hypothetical protein Q8A73_009199 [Channa argus]|nr:hypothetical protein Q8A73_009199 [Channa argus]